MPTADVLRQRRQSLFDLLVRSARRFPERRALVDGVDGRARTYVELEADAEALAAALHARGIGPGDRVLLLSRNSVAYAQAILGVARLGAVLVPVNFMLGAEEVGYVVGHSRAVAVLASSELREVAVGAIAAADAGDRLRARVELDVTAGAAGDDAAPAAADGWEAFSALLAESAPAAPEPEIAVDAPAQVLYTSGTESRPKGAVLSHDALIAQYTSCVVDGEMTSDDVQVHALPLFHCAQQHVFLLPALMLGQTSVILAAPEPDALCAAVAEHGATMLFCPPTVWIGLLRSKALDRHDVGTLRKGYYGAAIMPKEVLVELSERLPDVRLWNFYGQTELAPLATVLKPEDQLRKLGSAGRAALHVETRVVDDEGRSVPAGEVGEIVHRSPHAILEYLEDEEKTAEAFRGGWFHSGDLGVLDEDGYLAVVDRKKDMIKTGGENVASREVEEAVYHHPAVAEVAVVGMPHDYWIEAVVAFVVAREGEEIDEADVVRVSREHLAAFKAPKAVEVVAELPKNASGKVLKRELREAHARVVERVPSPA